VTWVILKVFIAAIVISFTSWLAGKRPGLAGFIIALPISSMIALALTYFEHRDAEKAILFARSIVLAVPISLLFFIPFLLADRIRLPFAFLYFGGILLLGIGYLAHRSFVS
jgi:hypothetical protein